MGVQTLPIVQAQASDEQLITNNESIKVQSLVKSNESLNVRNEQSEDSLQPDISDIDKICPVCSLAFSNDITFIEFQNHVVEHFIAEDQPEYEVI